MKEQLEYLMAAFDFHLNSGEGSLAAWVEALDDYAAVYGQDEDGRLPISKAAERVLFHIKKQEPRAEPIRKFVNLEKLTMHQFVITDAAKALATGGNRMAAIKLIRGAFAGKDNLFCPLAVAKEILDNIVLAQGPPSSAP